MGSAFRAVWMGIAWEETRLSLDEGQGKDRERPDCKWKQWKIKYRTQSQVCLNFIS